MPLSDEQRNRLAHLSVEERRRLRDRLRAERPDAAINGFRLVAIGLRDSGIRTLSGIPGSPTDALFSEPVHVGLRTLTVRHQTTAVQMAAAANYLAGRLEHVVAVSAGPAVTNTLTGILHARDNAWPVVVLGGRRPVVDEGAGYFQELDAVPIMASVTKWAATVPRTDALIPMLHEAVQVAISGTPGPVYLDLPEDVLLGSAIPIGVTPPVRAAIDPAPPATVTEALRLLRRARRPLLCLGEGIRWDYDPEAIRALVEREQLPYITTSLGRGLLPDAHPLCCNGARRAVQVRADLVLMAGAWFDYRFQRGAGLHRDARVIHVEPDPARRGRNVAAILPIAGAPGKFLADLAATDVDDLVPERAAWTAEVGAQAAKPAVLDPKPGPTAGGPMHPDVMYRELRSVLPDDAVVVVEGSFHMAFGQAGLERNRPLAWLDPGWGGCMGSGLPHALGARLAYPERPIVAIVGDTGFGLSGMELETAVRHDLPILVVVANNGGINGSVRQTRFLGDAGERVFRYGDDLRYDAVARALGAAGVRVASSTEFGNALGAALRRRTTTCIDVSLDPEVPAPCFW